jgi:hypothetical protein
MYTRAVGARLRVAASLCLACSVVAGCGHSARPAVASHKPTACSAQARSAFAQYLALPPARVATAASTGNNGFPQCRFSASLAGGGHVSLTANDYTGPQPYFILERTNVEQVQIFGPKRLVAAPVPVNNLGIEADWFPNRNWLMSTDGIRLITAEVTWPGASQAHQIALATVLSRTYLKTQSTKQAEKLARGYPSPSG